MTNKKKSLCMGRPHMKKYPFKMRIRGGETNMPAIMRPGYFVQTK